MHRWARLTFLLLPAAVLYAQPKPENLPLSTWIREDIFAGILADDMDRFEIGVKKLQAYLAVNPASGEGLAWLGATEALRAVRAFNAGQRAGFDLHYQTALKTFEAAAATGEPPVFAISGGAWSILSERLPPEVRQDGYRRAYASYTALKAGQAPIFSKLPVHMRGEVLGGLAQAAERIGMAEESRKYLQQTVNELPGTPYATRAQRWIDKPELSKTVSLTCQTCHDEGRLEPTLARLAAKK